MAYKPIPSPKAERDSQFRDLSVGQLFNFDHECGEPGRSELSHVHVKVSDEAYVEGPFYMGTGYCGRFILAREKLHLGVNPLGMMDEGTYNDIAAHHSQG